MSLAIRSAAYRDEGGYPFLELAIGDRTALLDAEPKPTLLEAGLVFLGDGWEDDVPPIDFSAPGVTPTTLRGFTADPAIVGLYRRFLEDLGSGEFSPGELELETASA